MERQSACPACNSMFDGGTMVVVSAVLLFLVVATLAMVLGAAYLLLSQYNSMQDRIFSVANSLGTLKGSLAASSQVSASIDDRSVSSRRSSRRSSPKSSQRQLPPDMTKQGNDSNGLRQRSQPDRALQGYLPSPGSSLNEQPRPNPYSQASQGRDGGINAQHMAMQDQPMESPQRAPSFEREASREQAAAFAKAQAHIRNQQAMPAAGPSFATRPATTPADEDGRKSLWDMPADLVESLRKGQEESTPLSRVDVSRTSNFIATLNLGENLGGGAFGQVFLCSWEGVKAAVKLLELTIDPKSKTSSVETFMQEAEVAALLRHPNIVQVYKVNMEVDEDKDDGNSYRGAIVMEYCELGSLADAIKKNFFTVQPGTSSPVDLQLILRIAEEVARGMLFLHNQDILHADLKPNNVLIKQGSEGIIAKLTDFGLSVQMSQSQTHVSQHQTGTLDHMAPEVMMEGKSSKRSDVYSYGILLWELYCCSRPYAGMRDVAIVHKVVEQDLRPVFPKTAPREYVSLASRCWDKDPMKRPSFSEIVARVEQMNLILTRLLNGKDEGQGEPAFALE